MDVGPLGYCLHCYAQATRSVTDLLASDWTWTGPSTEKDVCVCVCVFIYLVQGAGGTPLWEVSTSQGTLPTGPTYHLPVSLSGLAPEPHVWSS